MMSTTSQSSDGNIDLGGGLSSMYFTICDDMSNDSNDYVTINSSTTTITETRAGGDSSFCDQPLQYRILSQLPKTAVNDKTAVTLRAVALDGTRCSSTHVPALPANTTVQLPSGCEIYLVKEYVDSLDDGAEILLSEECEEAITPCPMNSNSNHNNNNNNNNNTNTNSNVIQTLIKSSPSVSIFPSTSIKTEPGTQTQFLASNVITSNVENTSLKATAGSVAPNYRKRDEKRRATHNEVERRRRDKINNWIFKLKEMLPTDNSIASKSKTIHGRLPADGVEKSHHVQQALQRSGGTSCRSPPNDSKSQILIKACEYIRAMQDELKSLRECLMENEKLRTSNIRLQNELEKYKNSEQRHQQTQPTCDDSFNDTTNNCSSPCEDFTLTLCSNASNNLDDVSNCALFTTTATSPNSISLLNGRKTSISVPFAKRELIITDYVD